MRGPARRIGLTVIAVFALSVPAHAADSDLSFVVLGHLRGNSTGSVFAGMDALVEQVNALDPDLVFLTGDLIWGDYNSATVDRAGIERDWDRLDAALSRLSAPTHRVPGNHDINDPITRDVWFERYGRPPQVRVFRGNRFLLLSSTRIPEGQGPPDSPRRFTRPPALFPAQLDFLRAELADDAPHRNAFVFLHHILWWDPEAPWWDEVHPLLTQGRVRAVFGGDYGPLKFSHVQRDGIEYLQSALEGPVGLPILRRIEKSRVLHYQLDNFLHVQVRDDTIDVNVEVVGALTSGKYTPELWHDIYREETPTLSARLENALGGPLRRVLLAGMLLGALGLGVFLGRRSRVVS